LSQGVIIEPLLPVEWHSCPLWVGNALWTLLVAGKDTWS